MAAKKFLSERGIVFAAIALGPILLIGPILLQGRALFWGTAGLQFVPWWAEAWRQLQMGSLPLWNSLNGMGAPLLANYQTAFFYPPNWILLGLAAIWGTPGIAWGYTLLAMLHLTWAGWGMAVLLRRLGVGPLAQVTGGLAFALSGYVVSRLGFFSMVWVTAWMPWIIRYADEINNPAGNQRRLIVQPQLIICLGLQYLAGHAQLAWYSTILMCGWVLIGCLGRKESRRLGWVVASLAITGLAAVLIAAIQMFPTVEYLSQSQRATEYGYEDAMVYSFWPWRLITWAAPDFFGNPGSGNYWGYATYWEDAAYIGMLPLIFALSTTGWFSKKNAGRGKGKFIGALWGLVGISILLALGKNTPIFPLLYRYIPTFALFQAPARYLIWAVFGLCILSAFGINQWKSPNRKERDVVRGYTVAALAVMLGAGAVRVVFKNVQLTFITATALAGLWAAGVGILTLLLPYAERKKRKGWWSAGVVSWVLADLLIATIGLNPSVSLDFYGPSVPGQTELLSRIGSNRVYLGASDEFTLKFKRFFRVKDYSEVEDWKEIRAVGLPNTNLLDQVSMVNNFDPFVPGRYSQWINLLESSSAAKRGFLLGWMGIQAVGRVDTSQPDGVRFDYSTDAMRYGWFTCARSVKDGPSALEAMTMPEENPDTLILEQVASTPGGVCASDHSLPGSVRSEKPDAIDLVVDTNTGGWIYLANTWYPGWTASVDGRAVSLYRANYLFQAVRVSKGKHAILLKYQPNSFYIGGIFSILISAVMICSFIFSRSLKKRLFCSEKTIRDNPLE
jgi:hypothetical protein